CQHSYGMPFTF
nr:immunoglobulin light chain junction region [Macaca mulatta]MOW72815.1 immunoglobulin light chain junction region [Macaca mulatta]MOW72825.1 immunoglobulin light chain junction region [Macaca mulatta]MOW72845.1 immunoglobulin light chain junction region [Macaca mulatta]MOW72846.1 immunoglobulin light chain junction region [Macaca mulatta]